MKPIFKQVTYLNDNYSLHYVPSLYDKPFFFLNMIRAKHKAGITVDQWRLNASYNIFLEASRAENPSGVY
jgi:hypothetical protein